VNHTRFPKEDHLQDWGCRDNQVKRGDRVDTVSIVTKQSVAHGYWRRFSSPTATKSAAKCSSTFRNSL